MTDPHDSAPPLSYGWEVGRFLAFEAVYPYTEGTQNAWSRLGDPGWPHRAVITTSMQVEALSRTLWCNVFESRWGYAVDLQQHSI